MAYRSIGRSNSDLISQLRENNVIQNARVEAAMRAVDRGRYAPATPYIDAPTPIGHGQTISAPHMHAAALEQLRDHLQPGSSALDVGSGTGYLTACMAHMVDVKGGKGTVVGIEFVKELVEQSLKNVESDDAELSKHPNMIIKRGDGWKGEPSHSPYNAIHVGAAAESIPKALVDQLANGGKMILPVGPAGGEQVFTSVTKSESGEVRSERLFGVMYVPLVKS